MQVNIQQSYRNGEILPMVPGTQMGKDDKAEADEKLSSEEAGNITEESICVLETRLKI